MGVWAEKRPQTYHTLIVAAFLILLAWSVAAFLVSKDMETVRAAVILSILAFPFVLVFIAFLRPLPRIDDAFDGER